MEQIQKKPTKTISGVAPFAVMLPPRKCNHGLCLYCPSLDAPQAYTPKSPAVVRAKRYDYSAKGQILSRLRNFEAMNHPTDKIEIIVMGGTFLQYPEEFQEEFILECYEALNGKKSKDMSEAKKVNETAKHRCVALCIETRPDMTNQNHIEKMLKWGTTRIELGVQLIDDEIYKKINRGHTVEDVIIATRDLKKAGFKIGYHIMPGLPFSNPKKDIKLYKEIFKNEKFKPDQIKIYPCQVIKGAGIEGMYYGGEYVPYSKELSKEIIIEMLKLTPNYCRVMRIMRAIPEEYLVAGVINIDMRKNIEEEIKRRNIKIEEIRLREIGFAMRDGKKIDTDVRIKTKEYNASKGKEFFIEALNKDNILFGLLRLRIEEGNKDIPTIRELHVYGPTLKLGEVAKTEWQHKGLGKILMKEAEKITRKEGHKKIRVISGVGVREYYRKLGYNLDKEEIYMEKEI
jgi:elongator complex protein 3